MLSVVAISAGNRATLERCLLSVAAQDVDALELVWVDDASVDGSFAHVQRLLGAAALRKRFARVALHANRSPRGPAAALNLGCRMATGALICTLGAADWFHSARLARLAARWPGGAHWAAFSGLVAVNAAGEPDALDPAGHSAMFDPGRILAEAAGVSAALLARFLPGAAGNLAFTRALFDAVGGFPTAQPQHGWGFLLQACWFCEPVFLPERLYYHRVPAAAADAAGVQAAFMRRVLLHVPANPLLPTPQRDPGRFWSLAARSGLAAVARRALLPYAAGSRMLDWP